MDLSGGSSLCFVTTDLLAEVEFWVGHMRNVEHPHTKAILTTLGFSRLAQLSLVWS